MTDKIGPSFPSELAAAGVPNAVAWDTATGALTRCLGVSDADFAKAEAVLAAHDPTKPAPTPAPVVPASVSNKQARLALINVGKFDAVDAGVRASKDAATITNWDYANDFDRDSPFIAAIAAALQMPDAEVDALFIAAAAIP